MAEFTERFDILHRTFLGYPVKLAETDRVDALLQDLQRHRGCATLPRALPSTRSRRPWPAGPPFATASSVIPSFTLTEKGGIS